MVLKTIADQKGQGIVESILCLLITCGCLATLFKAAQHFEANPVTTFARSIND